MVLRKLLLLIALIAGPASAQLPGLSAARSRRRQLRIRCQLSTIDALRADFAAQSGGATVYFGAGKRAC